MGSVSPARPRGWRDEMARWNRGVKVDVLRRMQATPSSAIGRADMAHGIISDGIFISGVSKFGFNGMREDVRLHTKKGKIWDPLFTCTHIISCRSSIK